MGETVHNVVGQAARWNGRRAQRSATAWSWSKVPFQAEQRAFAPQRQNGVVAVEPGTAVRSAHLPDLPAKIPLHRELPDFGVQLLDLALPLRLGLAAHIRFWLGCTS